LQLVPITASTMQPHSVFKFPALSRLIFRAGADQGVGSEHSGNGMGGRDGSKLTFDSHIRLRLNVNT